VGLGIGTRGIRLSSEQADPLDAVNERLIQQLRQAQGLRTLIGQAPVFRRAIAQIPAIARSDATVLICGETGTGKELVARAIHYLSPRAAYPFIAVNCGALPDTLLEDELFGHERGAFTDARLRQTGLIAQAEKGTLFLDEVGTLTARAQSALLRVVQDKTFRMLGSRREERVDVRFVAATNASLGKMVEAGTFRGDLYYRLRVFAISLPPLHDRREDVSLLAVHFLTRYAPADRPDLQFSPAASAALLTCDWPGNIRELEHAILRAAQVCRTNVIEVEDLGLPPPSPHATPSVSLAPSAVSSFKFLKRLSVETFERDYLSRLLATCHGNVTRAAHIAGKDRREFGRLLKKHHLDPKAFAASPAGS
jgi:two-component system, NtrC family, response regulator GlrR